MIEMKDILRGLREQKQVSMDKMCEDLNNIYNVALAKSTISKWENGKAEPSLAYARILTKYFNVTLDYLLGLEKEEMYNFNKLSKEETTLLENYNKLNSKGKERLIDYSDELTTNIKYMDNSNNEITATIDNVTEVDFNSNNKEDDEEVFVPYKSLDEFECVASHYDDLTEEEQIEADRRVLEFLNKRKLAEFNKRKNNK